MKPGELALVETSFGFHVVKLESHSEAHVDTLAQAKPAIIEAIRGNQGTRLSRDALNEDLSDALAGKSLQDIAKKRGLDVVEAPPVSHEELIRGTSDSRELLDAAFKLEVGQARGVPVGNAPYLIEVVARTPSHVPTLKDIEAKVRDAYIKDTAEEKARIEAVQMTKQIKSPADFASVAAQNKVQVKTADPFVRVTNDIPGIGQFPEVVDAASIQPTVPGVIDQVMGHDGNSFIFEVTSRTNPTDAEWKSDQKSFTQEFLARRRALAWQHFLDQLRTQATVTIDTEQLAATQASL
jgi:hypothetical protein